MTLTESVADRSTTPSTPHLAYVPGLDGLRAIAVIGVMLYHAGFSVVGGYLGVESFFVLSGFLITTLLLVEWQQHGQIDIRQFWLRRARRLLPALFVALAGTFLLAAILLPSELIAFSGDTLAALLYVMNWKLIFAQQAYVDAFNRPSLLQHLWSLAIEEQFYVLWPIVFSIGMRWLRPAGVLFGVLAAALASTLLMIAWYDPGSDPARIYYGTDTRVAAIFIGAALAYIWTPDRRNALGRRPGMVLEAGGIVALAGLVWAYGWLYEQHPLLYNGGFQAVALATALVIAATAYPGARILPTLLEVAPLRWLGVRSYSLYLWHWPIFVIVRPALTLPVYGWVLDLLCLGISIALAASSYRFIERPIRSAGFIGAWGALRARLRPDALAGVPQWRVASLVVGSIALIGLGTLLLVRQPRSMHAATYPSTLPTSTPLIQSAMAALEPSTIADPAMTPVVQPDSDSAMPTQAALPTTNATAGPALPQIDPALADRLQELLDDTVADGYIPGAVLSISVPGYAPWTGASGLADRNAGLPMTPTTPVRIASVSKMFTAVVVMQLVEEGVIRLDAPISTWLPESIPDADRITVEQLLQHTSGLYDYLEDRNFVAQTRREPDAVWQPQDLVDYATQFRSGQVGRWDYSSTNYVLLGMIVEQATGQPLAQHIHERIFAPLELRQAAFLPQDPAPANMAHGYTNGTDLTNASMSFAFATANLAMTTEELQRFGRALFTDELLRSETRDTMMQVVSGRGQYAMPDLAYGLGMMRNRLPIGPAPDRQPRAAQANLVFGHIGGYGGFRSALWYAPDSGVVIAIGLNQAQADPNILALGTLDHVLYSLGR